MGKAKDLANVLHSVCNNANTCGFCGCYEICKKYKIIPTEDKYAIYYSIKELTQKIKEYSKNEE